MRSSFNRAMVIKQMALGVLIASSFSLNLAANSQPYSGKVLVQRQQYLIAQGDASLPPPDPNYRPKSRFQADANGAGASDQAEDGPIRRRLRRQMNGGGSGLGDGPGSGANGLGAGPGGNGAGANGLGAGLNGFGAGRRRRGGAGAGVDGVQQGGVQQVGGALGAATVMGAPVGGGGRFKNGFVGGGGGGGGGMFGKKALDLTSLNLTPEQKQKIQDMRGQLGPKTRELRKQLNAKRMELRDMMFEANAGDDQVRAKRKEVRQLQDKVEDIQINDFLGIRSVLTPDQRLKLTDLKPGNKVAGTQLIAPVVTTP